MPASSAEPPLPSRKKAGRRPAKEPFRVSEGEFRALVEHSPEVLMLLDGDGCIVYITPSVSRHCGWIAEELIGRRVLEFLHPGDLAALTARLAGGFGSGSVPVSLELRIRQPDGAYRTIEGVAVNHLRERSVRAIVVSARDVTDRQRLEEQVRQVQKMEAVGRLAGGIAHDFNNLLTAILGYCDLLLEDLPPVAATRPDLEEIRKAGERAAALTRQLLAFSRRQIPRPQPIELSAQIGRLHIRLRELLGRQIELVMTLAPQLPMVNVDPAAIEDILVNLALNARSGLPNGGRLTIETTSDERDGANQRVDPADGGGRWVMIAVSDNGDGMDEATRSRVFEPLFTTSGQGTGLGLATVYGLVHQNGGSIRVESETGRGTTFRISLPSLETGASGAIVPGIHPASGAAPLDDGGSPR